MEPEYFEQFKANDDHALAAYFDRHVRALLLFAQRIIGEEHVAEELVQDAYVKLWMARDRIENEAHLKYFLYQTTRNACIDHLRSTGSSTQRFAVELDENIKQPDADLLARMIHAETLQLVYREVKNLSPTQQHVFRLTFIEGFTTEEICTELGMTANAVFIARSKALTALQRVFKGKDLLIYIAFLHLIGLLQRR